MIGVVLIRCVACLLDSLVVDRSRCCAVPIRFGVCLFGDAICVGWLFTCALIVTIISAIIGGVAMFRCRYAMLCDALLIVLLLLLCVVARCVDMCFGVWLVPVAAVVDDVVSDV